MCRWQQIGLLRSHLLALLCHPQVIVLVQHGMVDIFQAMQSILLIITLSRSGGIVVPSPSRLRPGLSSSAGGISSGLLGGNNVSDGSRGGCSVTLSSMLNSRSQQQQLSDMTQREQAPIAAAAARGDSRQRNLAFGMPFSSPISANRIQQHRAVETAILNNTATRRGQAAMLDSLKNDFKRKCLERVKESRQRAFDMNRRQSSVTPSPGLVQPYSDVTGLRRSRSSMGIGSSDDDDHDSDDSDLDEMLSTRRHNGRLDFGISPSPAALNRQSLANANVWPSSPTAAAITTITTTATISQQQQQQKQQTIADVPLIDFAEFDDENSSPDGAVDTQWLRAMLAEEWRKFLSERSQELAETEHELAAASDVMEVVGVDGLNEHDIPDFLIELQDEISRETVESNALMSSQVQRRESLDEDAFNQLIDEYEIHDYELDFDFDALDLSTQSQTQSQTQNQPVASALIITQCPNCSVGLPSPVKVKGHPYSCSACNLQLDSSVMDDLARSAQDHGNSGCTATPSVVHDDDLGTFLTCDACFY
ncbi:hypothetical protein GQ42DRAFT_180671 [Ramicandelaber brevisporus]|nr:hypothetical protein GQ42DRAFT_180671 [Ramicandelaber brevisporus]